jgi:hypothetical protein
MNRVFLVLLGFVIILGSCQQVLIQAAGIHKPSLIDNEKIVKLGEGFQLVNENIYLIDTLSYKYYVESIKKSSIKDYQDLMQPLQIKFFKGNDSLVFQLVNCSVGGFPNLKWNRLRSFDVYPPSMRYFKVVNYQKSLVEDTLFYHPLRLGQSDQVPDATIVVFWSRMMGRQSKRIIKQALNYKKRFPQYRIRLMFVNNDNLYI